MVNKRNVILTALAEIAGEKMSSCLPHTICRHLAESVRFVE
jgi:hypothetical protein